ncbi:hypothetical protein Ancab_031015 [Ancistrocladus abbreviatus]
MEEFPSGIEVTAASALLLLSATLLSRSTEEPPSIFTSVDMPINVETKSKRTEDDAENLAPSDTTSCPSSVTTAGQSATIQITRISVMAAAAARCQEMKLKVVSVVRRTRSKIHYVSSGQKTTPAAWKTSAMINSKNTSSESAEASCLSSGSSGISSARSPYKGRTTVVVREELKKRGVRSAHIRRRAEAILKFLSGGCSSEVRIRQVLGDSPDTSKALRMLLRMEEVRRTGAGGRSDPYIYTVMYTTLHL